MKKNRVIDFDEEFSKMQEDINLVINKYGDIELDRCPLYYFKGAIYIIKKYQQDDLDDKLNSFITDDYLTSTEAALLLNGLNPAAGNDIDSDSVHACHIRNCDL